MRTLAAAFLVSAALWGGGPSTLPLGFEANAGRFDTRAAFVARAGGYSVALEPSSLRFALRRAGAPSEVLLRFLGSRDTRPAADAPAALRANYFLGSDPSRWTAGVDEFARVRYTNLYAGIDLVLYESEGRLEHDFVVHPGADPRALALGFTGGRARLGRHGELRITSDGAGLQFQAPVVYQEIDGRRTPVHARFRLERGIARFAIGAYDRSRDLVIDPVITTAQFGVSGFSEVESLASDAQGNVYAFGTTNAPDFPTTAGVAQKSFAGGTWDLFVMKLDTKLKPVYVTYLGGSGDDFARAIKVDAQGNAVVTGTTSSANFSMVNPYQGTYGGASDAFLAKLDPTGSKLLYSTFLGGSGFEDAEGLALDSAGNIYVGGSTGSTSFTASTGAYSSGTRGNNDLFVAKFSPSGSLLYRAILGGSDNDTLNALAVDASGAAYFTGFTKSTNYPVTAGAAQAQLAGGEDAFLSVLNPAGSQLTYSTYLGGKADDIGRTLAVIPGVGVWVAGETNSDNFPVTPDAKQKTLVAGQPNGFQTLLQLPTAPLFADEAGARPRDLSNPTLISASSLENLVVCKKKNLTTDEWILYAPPGQESPCSLLVLFTCTDPSHTSCKPIKGYQLSGDAQDADLEGVASGAAFTVTIAGSATTPVQITPTTPQLVRPRLAQPRASTVRQAMVARIDFSADPQLSPGGIVHAASFASGAVAPGEIVTLFGANLGPSALATAQLDANGNVANSVAGTQIFFDGVPAPLVYTSAGQVSAIVPYAVQGKTSTVVTATYNGVSSFNAITVPVTASAPGLFTVGGGKGQAAALNQDGSYNSSAAPASAGKILVLFATGEGQTSPSGVDGKVASATFPTPALPVSVTIGGKTAQVLYAGAAPGEVAGLLQLNVVVPDGLSAGPAAVVLTVGSASSPQGVTVAVQ